MESLVYNYSQHTRLHFNLRMEHLLQGCLRMRNIVEKMRKMQIDGIEYSYLKMITLFKSQCGTSVTMEARMIHDYAMRSLSRHIINKYPDQKHRLSRLITDNASLCKGNRFSTTHV
ncbi:hypothetical protein ACOME3_009165 [Neoechinorhynchus agilis]